MEFLNSKLFTPWVNPQTGVTVYILTKKVAPVQENFYFVNEPIDGEGHYLWFYCAFPPSGTAEQGRTLGVVDLQTLRVRYFPDTQFNHASPYVDPENGHVYWCMGADIWSRSADEDDPPRRINGLPEEMIGFREIHRLATHLSRSPDGSEFFVDASIGLQYIFGTLPVDGGDFRFWHRFDRNFNHAQFNPVDGNLVLFAQENHPDQVSGIKIPIVDRMWLIRRGENPQPVFPNPTRTTHEWWDRDGKFIWCVRGNAAWKTDLESREAELVEFPQHCWHAHNSRDNRYIVADSNEQFYRGCPSRVGFLNRESGRYIEIVDNPAVKGIAGAKYHIDPHPRFCLDDTLVTFTTTMRGEIDLAVVRTDDLIMQSS